MESGSFVAVATAILTIVSVFLGKKYRKWLERGRLFAELLGDIVAAAEDDAVSEEEFQKIVAAAKQVAIDEDKLLITGRYTGFRALGVEGLATATGRNTSAGGDWSANTFTCTVTMLLPSLKLMDIMDLTLW